jgi:hypothetical protein
MEQIRFINCLLKSLKLPRLYNCALFFIGQIAAPIECERMDLGFEDTNAAWSIVKFEFPQKNDLTNWQQVLPQP